MQYFNEAIINTMRNALKIADSIKTVVTKETTEHAIIPENTTKAQQLDEHLDLLYSALKEREEKKGAKNGKEEII